MLELRSYNRQMKTIFFSKNVIRESRYFLLTLYENPLQLLWTDCLKSAENFQVRKLSEANTVINRFKL